MYSIDILTIKLIKRLYASLLQQDRNYKTVASLTNQLYDTITKYEVTLYAKLIAKQITSMLLSSRKQIQRYLHF